MGQSYCLTALTRQGRGSRVGFGFTIQVPPPKQIGFPSTSSEENGNRHPAVNRSFFTELLRAMFRRASCLRAFAGPVARRDGRVARSTHTVENVRAKSAVVVLAVRAEFEAQARRYRKLGHGIGNLAGAF